MSVAPNSGTTNTDVQVRATGFDAGDRITIGFGPPESEYEVVTHVRADASGAVTTSVEVPDWAEAGRDYLFVAATEGPAGDKAISSRFAVTAGETGDEGVEITGVLTNEGVECPALRTDDGDLYTLAGETGRFDAGDRVEVEGEIAELSICQQGTTITVENISDAG